MGKVVIGCDIVIISNEIDQFVEVERSTDKFAFGGGFDNHF